MGSYVCIRDCYYGPQGYRNLFKVGDLLPAGWQPGKHFAEIGGGKKPIEYAAPLVAGDDPRSTKEIINDLKTKHGIDMRGKPRKEAFAAWLAAEAGNPVFTTELVERVQDPLDGLAFSEINVSRTRKNDIESAIEERFAIDVKTSGKTKKELVEMAVELESKQVGARAARDSAIINLPSLISRAKTTQELEAIASEHMGIDFDTDGVRLDTARERLIRIYKAKGEDS